MSKARSHTVQHPRMRALAMALSMQPMFLLPGAAVAILAPGMVMAQTITVDGRTATTIARAGQVTDIRTGTVSGATGFNSFHTFGVPQGQIVNLHLPGGTENLVNIVRDSRSDIYGTLNAIKDGRIGGHVYFANPHGLVVGKGGVMNVGSLTLSTPTQAFVDKFFLAPGMPDQTAVAQLMDGRAPINGDAKVSIDGRINLINALKLQAGTISIAGGVFTGARFIGDAPDFSDVVNAQGLAQGSRLVAQGGRIVIEAEHDVALAGTLDARGSAGVAGGDITVRAGGDIEVGPDALITAAGIDDDSNGGRIDMFAQGSAHAQAGAMMDAGAGRSGDGGFIEFSARKQVSIAGNVFRAAAAGGGAAGLIRIDPEDLLWTGSGHDIYSHGAKIELTADESIVLDDVMLSSRVTGTADTRTEHANAVSTGASGDISLSAKRITLKNGTQLLAQGGNGKAGGKVSVLATDNQSTPVFGSTEDSIASISISGSVIKGGNIEVKALANDKWVWTGNEYGDVVLDFLSSLRLGANLTFSTAHATVDIDGGSLIDATGTLDIDATAKADASMKVMSTVVGFGYGETDAQAKVHVGQASLGSDGDMTIASKADSTLSVNVDTVNSGKFVNPASSASKYANFSFAVAIGNQVAETKLDANSVITRADTLTVKAGGEKAHGAAASGGSFKDGIASSGVSVLVSKTTITSSMAGQATAGAVKVQAELLDAETEVSAAAGTAGSPDLQEAITSARPVDEILFEKLSDFVAGAPPETDQRSGSSSKLGLSAAFAWVDNTNDVKAQVKGSARITSTGAVDVIAKAQESIGFETSAAVDQRDLDTKLPGDPNEPSDKKKVAISASVAVIEQNHHAEAVIEDGAAVNAGGAVTVSAEAEIKPFWSGWSDLVDDFGSMDWTSPSAYVKLASSLYGAVGDPVHATSWTQTAVESEKAAFAGAVDFFSLDNKATAKIGNATINQNVTTAAAGQDVTVRARANQGLLNLVGVPEFDPTSVTSGNTSSGKAGFGGSYHQFNLTGGTDASIAGGAKVRADDVAVVADTNFDQVFVTESVGAAAKVSINGAFSLVKSDVHTIAQIGAGGTLDANDVLVKAKDDSLLINVAGGVARSQSVGIGFSVAINDLKRETRALIGNRSTESATGGTLTASGNVLVDALASGTQGTFSVAGAGPSGQEKDPSTQKGGDGQKTNAADSGKQGKSGVGISATASVNLVTDTTAAQIADLSSVSASGGGASAVSVDIDGDGTAESVSLTRGVTVNAKNASLVLAGAGALSIATGKSAGLGGAFTWNQLVKDTRAGIADSTVTVTGGGVRVEAENSGAMWSVSASGAMGDKVGVAGSVAYSSIDNVTEAAIDEANVDADSTVIVDADDRSDIRSVGGAASYGGKAGVGAGVAISTVGNETTARVSGSGKTVHGDAGVSVTATNDNSIVSVAAALGASQGVAASGAVTVNIITNQTRALHSGATVSATGNAVSVDAEDVSSILSIAGSVAISTGQASIGIAAAYNEIDNETEAASSAGTLSGSAVTVEATEAAEIKSAAASGGGSAKVGVTGSLAINTITNDTRATATGSTLNAGGLVKIHAADTSDMLSITGSGAFGGTAGVGASGSYNHIGNVVLAQMSGGSVTAGGLQVDADRAGLLEVWAVAGSGGGTAGFAGSIALNDIGGSNTAQIVGAAKVSVDGNALVTAQSDDSIRSRAGSAAVGGTAGVGGAIALNDIYADTRAEVSGAGTVVTARGNGATSQVDNGLISGGGLLTDDPLDGRQQQDSVKGVAVVASSTSGVESFALSAGGGGTAGVAAVLTVNLVGGTTTASVADSAVLNENFTGASVDQQARVGAYHHTVVQSGTGGAAVGGTAGVGGAMDTTVVSHSTAAQVSDATLRARQAVKVNARSTSSMEQGIIGIGAGGYAGVAGSIGLIIASGSTTAVVERSNLYSHGSIDVSASGKTRGNVGAGAAAASAVASVGVTASVSVYDHDVSAIVTDNSQLNADGATTVSATSELEHDAALVTGSVAGGAGIAGTVGVVVIKGNTDAVVSGGADINADATYGGSEQDVTVSATDATRVEDYLGSAGVGLGGAGVGAAVDVVMVNNGVSARVEGGATVTADRDIAVRASATRLLDAFAVAAAGGATTGISGAITVMSVGARPDADARSESSGSLNNASQLVSANAFGNQLDSGASSTAASRDRVNAARAAGNASGDMSAAPTDTTATASVSSNSTLNADRDVEVKAFSATDTDAVAVGVAVSGGFSLGGGVALGFVDDRALAQSTGTINAGRNVTIEADDGVVTDDQGLSFTADSETIDMRSTQSVLRTYAGGGGVVGLGASVAILEKSSRATAIAGGSITALNGNVIVDAALDHDLATRSLGAAVGLAGVGAAIAYTTEDGWADAQVAADATILTDNLDVYGHTHTTTAAQTTAAAGGLGLAGAGADAKATDTSYAHALLGGDAYIRTTGGLTQVRASVDPYAHSHAFGVAVAGGVSIGVSMANSLVQTRSIAETSSGVDVAGADFILGATTVKRSSGRTAFAEATGASGGLLAGLAGTETDAQSLTTTSAALGDAAKIDVTHDVTIEAVSSTNTRAEASGFTAGLIAGGSHDADATATTTTTAIVGDTADIDADNRVKVRADGTDRLYADTTSGSGGLGSVVAGKAQTHATSHTEAHLGRTGSTGGTIDALRVEVLARQRVEFNSRADSLNASVAGYSGARAVNTVDTFTVARVGSQVQVNTEALQMRADNETEKWQMSGYNVDSASGGLLNGAAGRSESSIRNRATAEVGADADIEVVKAGAADGSLDIEARNEVLAYDKTRLDSGGAIAIARSESEISTSDLAQVLIGARASVKSDGEINLSALSDEQLYTVTRSTTYGLAGAAQGESRSLIGVTNQIVVERGALVEGEEDVYLMAGANRSEGNDLNADADTRLWNYTAFPVETDVIAHAQVSQNNQIDIRGLDNSSNQKGRVRSVKDVFLTAAEGSHTTRGFGEGTDAYRAAAEEVVNFFGDLVGADDVSFKISGGSTRDVSRSSVNIDGAAQAGIRHHEFLTFNADGTFSKSEAMSFTLDNNVSLSRALSAEITRLRNLANDYRSDQPDVADAFDHDADILQGKLNALGGDTALVDFLRIGPVTAQAGNVRISGDALTGAGAVEAPGDVRIDIVNHSKRFLSLSALTIPDEGGGDVTFNGVRVSSAAAINARNPSGAVAGLTVLDASNSPDPVIHVENTNDKDVSSTVKSPAELHITGDVNNLRGKFTAKSHGTILSSANINAETIDIATNGDFIKTFTFGFTHQGGDPVSQLGNLPTLSEAGKKDISRALPARDCGTDGKGCSTTIAGNNVFISAERLNINGVIQAGLADRTMTIDEALLGGANAAKISAARTKYLSHPATADRYVDLFVAEPGTSSVTVRYDAANDRLELGGVRFGGGHMELYGDIFSTGNGELRVLDGYGRINITNNTTYDIALNRLDTGPGVEGLIRITDTSQKGADKKALVTEITRLGNTIHTRTSQTQDAQGNPTYVAASADGRTTTYQPQLNRRFNWINGQKTTNTETRIYTTKILFGADWLYPDFDDPDTVTPGTPKYTPRLQGDWLSTDGVGKADYVMDYSVSVGDKYRVGDPYEISRTCVGICKAAIYEEVTIGTRFDWKVSEIFHHSLNASKSVNVNFVGHDAGDAGVSVVSAKGKVLIGDTVRSLTDTLKIDAAKGIEQLNENGRLVGSNVNLSAAQGAIGTALNPVRIDLTDAQGSIPDGTVSAEAKTGVHLREVEGDMRVKLARATEGDVSLQAERSLLVASNPVIQGANISLSAERGGIGSSTVAFLVNTGAGVLKADAAEDIRITESSGDLRVHHVRSEGGNVTLIAPGSLIDANDVETEDTKTRTDLELLWDELALRGGAAQSKADRTVEAYERSVTQDYRAYWQMRNAHQDAQGNWVADAYDPAYAYSVSSGMANALKKANGWNDADVAAFAQRETARYHAAHARFGSAGYDATFAYSASAAEVAAHTAGAEWNDTQLANALAAGLFRPVADTELRIEEANVAARGEVNLQAGAGIGRDNGTYSITRGSIAGLSAADRLALLTAERSDITLTDTKILVKQKEDFDVTAPARLDASAQQDILIGSEEDLTLGRIVTPGEARIKTSRAMQAIAGLVHVQARNVVLEAGGGHLGSAIVPVRIELPTVDSTASGYLNVTDQALTARAAGDLYVAEETGDLRINSVYSRATAHLSAPGAIVDAHHDRELDVLGNSLELRAGTQVGEGPTPEMALDVGTGAAGRLDASAPGGVFLYSKAHPLSLGDVSTPGGFFAQADGGSIRVRGALEVPVPTLKAADDIIFDGGRLVTAGPVNLEAGTDGSGDIDIRATASGDPAIDTPEAVLLKAAQDITLGARIVSASSIDVFAGEDIAMNGGALSTDGPLQVFAGLSGVGDLRIDAPSTGGNALRSGGQLDVSVSGDAQIDASLVGGADLSIRVDGAIRSNGKGDVTAQNDVLIEAGDGIELGHVRARTGSATLKAGQDLVAKSIRAAQGLILESREGSISVPELEGDVLSMSAKKKLNLGTLSVASSMFFNTDDISAKLIHTGTDKALRVSATGQNGAPARIVDLQIDSKVGVVFDRFEVVEGKVLMLDGYLRIDQGYVEREAQFRNPVTSVMMDNVGTSPRGFDIQLYEPTLRFVNFELNGWRVASDSYVITRHPDHQVVNSMFNDYSGLEQSRELIVTRVQKPSDQSAAALAPPVLAGLNLNLPVDIPAVNSGEEDDELLDNNENETQE